MGGMLVDSKNDCCCPEMRCCTPTTVTATVSGMAGQTWRGPTHFRPFGTKAFDGQGGECYVCNDSYFLHSIHDALALNGRPTGTIEGTGLFSLFYDWLCYNGDPNNPWPPAAFPPANAILQEVGCVPYTPEGEDPITCESDFRWGGGAGSTWDALQLNIVRWAVDTTLCEINGKLCQRPDAEGLHAGPCNGLRQVNLSHEGDLNGTYVLHRPEVYLRPQLKCQINRQVPITDSPYRGVTEAQLLYNVDPRRTWVLLGPPWECWDIMFPAEGDDYCVDYRCGKRNPWYSAQGGQLCSRGRCTSTRQGLVEPHLYYYHQSLNQTADLKLRLVPRDYETDVHGRFPTWWRVGSVQVRNPGAGYSVGEFFQIDYEAPFMRQWLGGEIMTVFPKMDESCFPPYYPLYVDKYGYSGSDVGSGWLLFQRLRISEVDDNGGIVSVEVVPIYKQPEYKDPPFCNVERVGDERTKFYVGYGRLLCHPRSVQFGGKGYNIGDTIEFYCDDPSCEEVEPAIAHVTDVDDEGAILDWSIRGTDSWRYVIENFCTYPFTVVDGYCVTNCLQPAEGDEVDNDERGTYKWKANLLCDLTWEGVGVPARGANVSLNEGALQVPCLNSHPWWESSVNTSNLTTLTLRIARQACETSIEVYVAPTPFVEAPGGAERARYLFPAYPRCAGGGAVVRPLFGAPGANESDFGSALAGGHVEAGGTGYCYRDKHHVAPTLPIAVPDIGNGTGAVIAAFDFDAVNNFPNPAIDWIGNPPDANRFSYFPVTGATIGEAGSGYEVGQEFDVSPAGGRAVSDMWSATGGDTPEECPNGAWYDGERATLNNDGYISILYDYEIGQYNEPRSQRPSKCRLRVSSVDANGGITGLEVVHGGMMFRTIYGDGKRNPLAIMWLQSTLGYGAYIEGTFGTDHTLTTFGQLTGVSVVAPPPGTGDPKHPGVPNPAGGWIASPGTMPTGGRDYADVSAGYFWMLQNTQVGNPVCPPWQLLAHLGWGGRGAIGGSVIPSPPNGDVSEPRTPRNFFHESYSTHNVVLGSMPTFVPMSSVCAFSDCYHDLLNRTYPLCKVWGGACPQNGVDGPGSPIGMGGEGAPPTGHAMLCKKGKSPSAGFGDPSLALGSDYVVIEYGPQLSLGYATPSPCPDHSNGTTTRE